MLGLYRFWDRKSICWHSDSNAHSWAFWCFFDFFFFTVFSIMIDTFTVSPGRIPSSLTMTSALIQPLGLLQQHPKIFTWSLARTACLKCGASRFRTVWIVISFSEIISLSPSSGISRIAEQVYLIDPWLSLWIDDTTSKGIWKQL